MEKNKKISLGGKIKELANKISSEIMKHVNSGVMLKKTEEDILNSKSFVIFKNKNYNEIFGFYEIRKYIFNNQIYWEMGSVISKKSNFFRKILLPDFEINRKKSKYK